MVSKEERITSCMKHIERSIREAYNKGYKDGKCADPGWAKEKEHLKRMLHDRESLLELQTKKIAELEQTITQYTQSDIPDEMGRKIRSSTGLEGYILSVDEDGTWNCISTDKVVFKVFQSTKHNFTKLAGKPKTFEEIMGGK